MKTIVRKGTNVSLYLLDDNVSLDIQESHIVVGDPAMFIIGDCGTSNVDVHENVADPGDWQGWKYFYDGQAWTLNPDWTQPA